MLASDPGIAFELDLVEFPDLAVSFMAETGLEWVPAGRCIDVLTLLKASRPDCETRPAALSAPKAKAPSALVDLNRDPLPALSLVVLTKAPAQSDLSKDPFSVQTLLFIATEGPAGGSAAPMSGTVLAEAAPVPVEGHCPNRSEQ